MIDEAATTRTWRPAAAVVATFVVATAVMTWPYVNYRALGHASYEGDARLVVWMIGWANHALIDGLPFFQSNLFFPAPETLRYNEHLFGVSVFALPFTLAGVAPVVAHNVLWWWSFVLNGVAAYVWLRRFVADRLAAVVGGLAFAFSFFVMGHAHAHLQLQWMWGVPASLHLLARWFDAPTPARALAWTAVLTMQVLTSWYLAVIALVANALQALVLLRWPAAGGVSGAPDQAPAGRWRARLWQGAAAVLLMAACVWPFARPYVGISGTAQAALNSADLASYLVPPQNTLVGRWWTANIDARPRWIWGEQTLFAGWTLLGLAAFGVAAFRGAARQSPRVWIVPLLAIGGFLLSLGPDPVLLGGSTFAPFAWLSAMPGVSGMRAPARFAALATLGLAGLGALGAEHLRRAGRAGRVAVLVAIPMMLAEWYVIDFPGGTPQPLTVPPVYESAEVKTARAIVSLPDAFGTPQWYADADYVYFSTAHWRPIVNGFGRDAPPGHADLIRIAHEFPASAGTLRAFGIDYVVVHTARYATPEAAPVAAALEAPGVRLVRQYGGDYLFALRP